MSSFEKKEEDQGCLRDRIIVAEDQIENMLVLKEHLSTLGKTHDCEFVYNGEEAVLKFSELVSAGVKVSHILTDFKMPRVSGIDAVRKIKEFIEYQNQNKEEKINSPKIVFLTAYKTSAFDAQLRDLGVETVFEKPLSAK